MPYHVELRRARRHARLFNLEEAELRRTILEPWALGVELELAGQRWERRDATLRVLEGPMLAPADLAFGQGWNRAERTARDVTADLLNPGRAGTVAVLAPSSDTAAAAAALLGRLGLEVVDWSVVRRRIMGWISGLEPASGLEVAGALLVCVPKAPDWWLLDAGIALGALGSRAVLVQSGDGPTPPAVRDLDVLRLSGDPAAALTPLAARLRRAGWSLAGP